MLGLHLNGVSMAGRCWPAFTGQLDPLSTQLRGQNAEKVMHIKGRLLDRAVVLINCVPFKMRASLKGKNLLPEGANYFLYEQFLKVWKVTFITLGDLPWTLLFLLRTYVTCVMGATQLKMSELSRTPSDKTFWIRAWFQYAKYEGLVHVCHLRRGSKDAFPRLYRCCVFLSFFHTCVLRMYRYQCMTQQTNIIVCRSKALISLQASR